GRIDDGRKLGDAIHAQIGNREGPAAELFGLEAPATGPLDEVLRFAGDLAESLAGGVADDRREQPSAYGFRALSGRYRHRQADVDLAVLHDVIALGVALGAAHKGRVDPRVAGQHR